MTDHQDGTPPEANLIDLRSLLRTALGNSLHEAHLQPRGRHFEDVGNEEDGRGAGKSKEGFTTRRSQKNGETNLSDDTLTIDI